MTFQFITSDIGPKERRLIRSHVMVGKNAGRPRPTRKRKLNTATKQSTAQHAATRSNNLNVADHRTENSTQPMILDRLIWNDLTFTVIPQPSPKSVELLRRWLSILDRRLYPPEFCSKLDFMDYVWLQYVFYDEGYMHGVFAIKASSGDSLGLQAKISPNALEHLSKAYNITQRRLTGPEAVSDKSIAGVTILAIYQLVHGSIDVGLVHFDGLCRMVRLRGGLTKLMKHNRALAQKPWRIDLEFALRSGLPMRFSGVEAPILDNTTNPKVIYPTYTKLCQNGIDAKLIYILSDTMTFTNLLNATDEMSKIDPLDFSEQAFSIIHRLIDFAPLRGTRPGQPLDDLLQLTLLAIMTASLPNYTPGGVRYELLAEYLKGAIQRYEATNDEHWKLLLWAVFVGRVSILHSGDDIWIMPMLLQISQHIHIHTWPQVRQILRAYCWIHVSHDAIAMKIWERAEKEENVDGAAIELSFRAKASTAAM